MGLLFLQSLKKNNDEITQSNPSFVLIGCDKREIGKIKKELSSISLVSKVVEVEGVYELVVKTESDSVYKIKNMIASKIRTINGVRTCLPLFGADPNYLAFRNKEVK